MNLHEVHKDIEKNRRGKRIGRGVGSGRGKTSGRGHKGQRARAGWKALSIFQGGSMPLVRRVPKRGFNNRFALEVKSVNVGELNEVFEAGDEVTAEQLNAKGLLRGSFDVLKILGDGELSKKLTVSAHRFSAQAKAKIEQAGGQAVVLPGKTPVAVKQKQALQAQGGAKRTAAQRGGAKRGAGKSQK